MRPFVPDEAPAVEEELTEVVLLAASMRTMHNGILIGIETLLNDDPLLNGPCPVPGLPSAAPRPSSADALRPSPGPLPSPARDLPPLASGEEHPQPTPIILDARARFPLTSRLFRNFKAGTGKRPWVVCDSTMCRADRRIELEDAGCRIIVMPTKGTGASSACSPSSFPLGARS